MDRVRAPLASGSTPIENPAALSTRSFEEFFRGVTGHEPYAYQLRVAEQLFQGRNVVLRAPTGSGKTWSVIAPFLFSAWQKRPARLIYALPLRTLAQGVYADACDAASRLELPVQAQTDQRGLETSAPYVTLQTGEQPDDRFFDRGRIIVTTYDQLLSGLLGGPYGLSDRLHNINAAAAVGALVVFDEFHLMEPRRAFLTATALLHLFRGLCQSVWMTATATQPLQEMLRDALSTVCIPGTDTEAEALFYSLPSVERISRDVLVETEALSAESVLKCHEGRTLVLLNTVGRAQAMYEELQGRVAADGNGTPLILLHSRFFKGDRRAKEEMLRAYFGKLAKGPAILVATQVVEAGLDISCEHLHTEICPMNALVQRAGRCARFAGEAGTVHVYHLPPEERAWLPYGDLFREDVTLSRTRTLLERIGRGSLHPRAAAEWVQDVHGLDDQQALREGWQLRLRDCIRRIEQSAILRDPKRVSDLIRGDDTNSLRVIINDEVTRPEYPGDREGLSLSRWSLARLLRNTDETVGWFWNGDEEQPWRALQTNEDIEKTYVVCLRPSVAAYDSDRGLRLGIPGTQESPPRIEPKPPGHAPLRRESWADHARLVTEEAHRRLEREHWRDGLLDTGFEGRYGLSPRAISEAVKACALLHDLGKLQEDWQRWAEVAQKAADPGYQHRDPLAHTDFDPEKPKDRERLRRLSVRRPAHAPASAYYARAFLPQLLSHVTTDQRAYVASACTAAILAHHGGWWLSNLDLNPPRLWSAWGDAVTSILDWAPDAGAMADLAKYPTERLLQAVTDPEDLPKWWPLVAFLTRTLRLSDQRATAEGASSE